MGATAAISAAQTNEPGQGGWLAAISHGAPVAVPGMTCVRIGGDAAAPAMVMYSTNGAEGPSHAAACGCAVAFDGFLYNATELAASLERPDQAANPAAIALLSYQRWGRDFPARLSGRFALFLHDSRSRVALAVRDKAGLYPCFFARAGRDYLVSTDAESLLRHPRVSREINRCAIVDYIADYWPSLSETFYANILRVPPGSMICAEAGAEKVQRYWNLKTVESDTEWLTQEEAQGFDEILVGAVDRSLDCGPSAIFLSGGLDSVSIAALAKDRAVMRGMPRPHALSLAFRDSEANEEERQRAVARQLGLSQDVVPFLDACGPAGFLRGALELSAGMTFPLINLWLACYGELALLGRARGCRAILTGSGGDEWLGVTPFLAGDLMRTLNFAGLQSLWRAMRRSYPRSLPRLARLFFWRVGARAFLREAVIKGLLATSPASLNAIRLRRMLAAAPQWLTPDNALERRLRERVAATQTCPTSEPGPYGMYFSELRLSLDHPLVSWELEESFETGRRLGMEFLHPYWDSEVVEMLWRTPPEILNQGGLTKGLVRGVVAKRFPALGFDEQRKVEVGPFFYRLIAGDAMKVWRDGGGAKALVQLGLADADKLDLEIKTILNSNEHTFFNACKIFDVMNIDRWLRSRI